ncbi:MAG: PKD domain-containing protein [Candidatus Cyclobacteriaceae bacterium M3_2C_046]
MYKTGLLFYIFLLLAAGCQEPDDQLSPQEALSFHADKTVIQAGEGVNFFASTHLTADQWLWEFPGGNPATSNLQNPTNISYPITGRFPVTVQIISQQKTYRHQVEDYITVRPHKGTLIFSSLLAEKDSLGPADQIWIKTQYRGAKAIAFHWKTNKGSITGSGEQILFSRKFCDQGIAEVSCTIEADHQPSVTRKINLVLL